MSLLANRPVPGRKRLSQMPKDSIYLNFVPFIESRVPADSQLIYKRGTGPTSHLTPSP